MAEIPTEALEAAARALANAHYQRQIPPWVHGNAWDDPPVPLSAVEGWREGWREVAQLALAAAAPYLIAEGRRQAAAELLAYADNYPEDVFRPEGESRDAIAGTAMRHAYRTAAVLVLEGNHG